MKPVLLYLAVAVFACVNPVRGSDNVLTKSDPAALTAAVQQGGSIKLAFDGIVSLTNSLMLTTDTILDATGRNVRLDGGGVVRHFTVASGISLTLTNLTLVYGRNIGADGEPDRPGIPAQGGPIDS